MTTLTPTVLVLGLLSCADKPDSDASPRDTGSASPQADTGNGDEDGDGDGVSHPALGPVQVCTAPQPEPTWTEVGTLLGLIGRPDDGRVTGEATYMAIDDFDGDGDLDVLTSVFGHTMPDEPADPARVFYWDGSAFNHVEIPYFESAWHPTLGDVDNDGDRDILTPGSPTWLRNVDGEFENEDWTCLEVARLMFIREFEPHDINGDGLLDLFALGSHPESDPELGQDFILWGTDDNQFSVDHSAMPILPTPGTGFDALWLDWEGDGPQEIFVANDRGSTLAPNSLWSWNGSGFTDISAPISANLGHDAMGADAADFNGDGVPDLYISATNQNVLLLSQPDGTLADEALTLDADPVRHSTAPIRMGWSGLFVDYDNDGQTDLFTTQGDWWDTPGERPLSTINLLGFNGEKFDDVSAQAGVTAEGSFRGAVTVDFNDDGLQDFLVSSLYGDHLLFLSEGCTAQNWLSFTGTAGIRVQVTANGQVWTDWIMSSSGFGAHTLPLAHIGLGTLSHVDRIEAVLPSGEIWAIDGPIATRRTVNITP